MSESEVGFNLAMMRQNFGSSCNDSGLPAGVKVPLTTVCALLAANDEQIRLYHDIGRDILNRQSRQGWGAKVIERLSADLRAAFPDMNGLSSRNLKYMKFFAQECPDLRIGQQSAAQLPWFHIVTLITKLSDHSLRD